VAVGRGHGTNHIVRADASSSCEVGCVVRTAKRQDTIVMYNRGLFKTLSKNLLGFISGFQPRT
jgi:hypothetical protein